MMNPKALTWAAATTIALIALATIGSELSRVCGRFASGGGDYSGQKKAVQLMPDVDALWTASRGKIQNGTVRILLLVDFELIQIKKCRFDCARVPLKGKRP
jgi:hypothetical protein